MKTVVLIGDSIRMGYESTVRSKLVSLAEVWTPADNGETSAKLLAHLDDWALSRQADIIHFNCGLHDIKREFDQTEAQVPLSDYAANVRSILTQLRDKTAAAIIWATSTPVSTSDTNTIAAISTFCPTN